jgi:hypothetical protein
VVERVLGVLLDDGPLLEEREDLERGREGVDEDAEEKERAAGVERRRVRFQAGRETNVSHDAHRRY